MSRIIAPSNWNPFDISNAGLVDHVLIAGKKSPGLCIVDIKSERDWDEQHSPGFDGSLLIYRGRKAAHVTLTFSLWTAEDITDWNEFEAFLRKMPLATRGENDLPIGQAIKAWDIVHPHCQRAGVNSVVLQSITTPKQEETGEFGVVVELLEWTPRPKIAVSKPVQSEPVKPSNPREAEVERVAQQIEAERSKHP